MRSRDELFSISRRLEGGVLSMAACGVRVERNHISIDQYVFPFEAACVFGILRLSCSWTDGCFTKDHLVTPLSPTWQIGVVRLSINALMNLWPLERIIIISTNPGGNSPYKMRTLRKREKNPPIYTWGWYFPFDVHIFFKRHICYCRGSEYPPKPQPWSCIYIYIYIYIWICHFDHDILVGSPSNLHLEIPVEASLWPTSQATWKFAW